MPAVLRARLTVRPSGFAAPIRASGLAEPDAGACVAGVSEVGTVAGAVVGGGGAAAFLLEPHALARRTSAAVPAINSRFLNLLTTGPTAQTAGEIGHDYPGDGRSPLNPPADLYAARVVEREPGSSSTTSLPRDRPRRVDTISPDLVRTAAADAGSAQTTGHASSRLRSAAAVIALGVLITGLLAWTSRSQFDHNEDRLINLRVKEAGSLISGALPGIQTPLASAATLADASGGDTKGFQDLIGPQVGTGKTFVSASLWAVGSSTPVAVVGV